MATNILNPGGFFHLSDAHMPRTGPIARTYEVSQLASRYGEAHRPATAAMACLWHLTTTLLTRLGAQHGTNVASMVDLLHQAIRTHADVTGVLHADIDAAVVDLQRAGETAAYLHSLPD